MVAAADQIHAEVPDFQLLVIGDGPSANEINAAAASRPWLKCVGARKGREKAAYFRLADIIFNPGAVGLHVNDSFCAGIPMATTFEARHGPEFAYLNNGRNCIVIHGGFEQLCESDYPACCAMITSISIYVPVREIRLRDIHLKIWLIDLPME